MENKKFDKKITALIIIYSVMIIVCSYLLSSMEAKAGTCSSITFTSAAARSQLTSTKYNTDNSTIYDFVNAYDGGCVSSRTLENDAISTSSNVGFAVPLNGIFNGCKVTLLDSSTMAINNCMASVNDKWVKTVTNTNVNWTHLDTGSEATGTLYYIYIDSTSNGTTLTPVISVTAPGTDGLNGSDRILARVVNDANGDFRPIVRQWKVNDFDRSIHQETGTITATGWTTSYAQVAAYETLNGDWNLRFSFGGSDGSQTTHTVNVSGVTFKDDPGGRDYAITCAGSSDSRINYRSIAVENTSRIFMSWDSAESAYFCSGDVPLESRPLWAN